MAKITTDSPVCRRIARSFVDFLDSVEPAQGVDSEALEVVRECLSEAFKLNSECTNDQGKSVSLIDIFSSLEEGEAREDKSDLAHRVSSAETPTSSTTPSNAGPSISKAAEEPMEVDWKEDPHSVGFSKDELFGQFFGALEKVHFFRSTSDGNDDPVLLAKATCLFHDALSEMERAGCQSYDVKNLAEALKSLGNKAMQSKLYLDAIELYSFAIALRGDNAVFYCNRAAAYTQINKCTEAIRDCLKSIEIDPSYSKAYSRLGLAYYAQGNYRDAIEKGFKKALELDGTNESVKENIKVAEQKLREEQQRAGRNSSTSSGNRQEPGGQSSTGEHQFSMPFSAEGLPPELSSMFMNMAGNVFHGQVSHGNQRDNGNGNGNERNEPEVRVDGNINLNFVDQMPDDLGGALRSVMQMFAGASSPPGNNSSDGHNINNSQNDNHNRDPTSGRSN